MTILFVDDESTGCIKKGIRTNCKTLKEAFIGANPLALRELKVTRRAL